MHSVIRQRAGSFPANPDAMKIVPIFCSTTDHGHSSAGSHGVDFGNTASKSVSPEMGMSVRMINL